MTNGERTGGDWATIAGAASLRHPDRVQLQSQQPMICPLDHLGLIQIRGAEAIEFLNKLVSCKLEAQNKQPQFCALCNPKGRVLSCFVVFYKDDSLYLQMPRELLEPTLQRLQMYVLMTKVELAIRADLLGSGIIGTSSPPESSDNPALQIALKAALRAPGHLPRYFVYADVAQTRSLWRRALAAGYTPTTSEAWHYCDIRSGLAHIYLATREKLTPQMINLDLMAAVSFSKGCYPGQEIVARTHYLGKLKRRCYLFSAASDALEVAAPVYRAAHSEACGLVIDRCALASNDTLGLLSMQIAARHTPELYVKTSAGSTVMLHIEAMPYPVKETSHDAEKNAI